MNQNESHFYCHERNYDEVKASDVGQVELIRTESKKGDIEWAHYEHDPLSGCLRIKNYLTALRGSPVVNAKSRVAIIKLICINFY